jgi:hypothetical protein
LTTASATTFSELRLVRYLPSVTNFVDLRYNGRRIALIGETSPEGEDPSPDGSSSLVKSWNKLM